MTRPPGHPTVTGAPAPAPAPGPSLADSLLRAVAALRPHPAAPPDAAALLALLARRRPALPGDHLPRLELVDRATLQETDGPVRALEQRCAARRVALPTFEGTTQAAAFAWAEALAKAHALADARSRMVRAPAPLAGAWLDARAGRLAPDTPPTHARDRSGRTFTVTGIDLAYWDLCTLRGSYRHEDDAPAGPSRRVQLVVPVGREVRLEATDPAPHVRTHLTPGMMRAWLAGWWLAERWDDAHPDLAGLGYFALDTHAVLHDLYGLAATTTRVGGKTYHRPPVSAERSFRAQFARLEETFIRAVGIGPHRLEPQDPERLVTFVRDGAGRRTVYRHAVLALTMMRRAFVQMPVAALRLGPDDTPLALGLAALWRARIGPHVLHGRGQYRVPVAGLADELGEDWRAGARHDGRAYWPRLVERLARVMRDGELGTLHVARPEAAAPATLVPSEALVTVYRSVLRPGAAAAPRTTDPAPRPTRGRTQRRT
jgi:hypothetical protein